jgi:hypothetical protein
MEVGQGQNWGCSAKEKKNAFFNFRGCSPRWGIGSFVKRVSMESVLSHTRNRAKKWSGSQNILFRNVCVHLQDCTVYNTEDYTLRIFFQLNGPSDCIYGTYGWATSYSLHFLTKRVNAKSNTAEMSRVRVVVHFLHVEPLKEKRTGDHRTQREGHLCLVYHTEPN